MGTVVRLPCAPQNTVHSLITAKLHQNANRSFSQSRGMKQAYGWIGLGQMGFPMARNLRRKMPPKDILFVHDINRQRVTDFCSEHENVQMLDGPLAVAEQSDVIITSLPESLHVREVYNKMLEGSTGNKKDGTAQRLFLDTSTIDTTTSQSIAELVHTGGHGTFVDAPMSGGVRGAQNATLTFMIGCSPAHVEKARAVLSHMGARVVHMGPVGSGLKMKLTNNYLLALNNIATCEAMAMGTQFGLDPRQVTDVINTSTGRCWPSVTNNPVPDIDPDAPSSHDYAGGFNIALSNKDLKLALAACNTNKIENKLGAHAVRIYDEAQSDDIRRTKDFSVIYQLYEKIV